MHRTPGDTATSPEGTRGRYRDFERGVVYTSDKGTFVIHHRPIFDAYRAQGYEGGTLVQAADGTVRQS